MTISSWEKEMQARADAQTTELSQLHSAAVIIGEQVGWSQEEPQTAMAAILETMPDNFTIHKTDTLHLIPREAPPLMELYLMSRLPESPSISPQDIATEGLGVVASTRCLRDRIRTKKLFQGVGEAIEKLESTLDGPIEMYEAGTGALAAVCIFAASKSDRIRCTALEINHKSAVIARQVVEGFGLQDRVRIMEADATTYIPEKPIDLLVSETMHTGLTQEPIVQILSNLQPHVRPGGITLPSKIRIKAGLMTTQEFADTTDLVRVYDNRFLRVIRPEWQEVAVYTPGDPLEQISFQLEARKLRAGSYLLFVTNDVEFGSGKLTEFQSLITMPLWAHGDNYERTVFNLRPYRQKQIAMRYTPGQDMSNASRVIV
jgi:predicted RNA methylase